MKKHPHRYILFALFVFSLAFSAPEYVQCEHCLPDEMLDHAALADQSGKHSLRFFSPVVHSPFPGVTVSLSCQGFLPPRSSGSFVHSKTIPSAVIRI